MCNSDRLQNVASYGCILLSMAMLGLGACMVYSGTNADNALFRYKAFVFPSEFATSPRVVILIGAFLFAIVWIQLSAAIKESVDLMFMSTFLLTYLVLCGAVSIYFGISDQSKLNTKLYFGMLSSLMRFREESEDAYYLKKEWELLQLSKNCCGTNNYTDWRRVPKMPDDPPVPPSCCIHKVAWCSTHIKFNTTVDSQWIYTQGCYSKVLQEVSVEQQLNAVFPFEVVGSLSVLTSAYLLWAWHRRSRAARVNSRRRPYPNFNGDNQVLVIDSHSESNSDSVTDTD